MVSLGRSFGSFETCMAGPDAVYVNGARYFDVVSDRPFVMLTLPYGVPLANFMHNNGHRAEDLIARAYNYDEDWKTPINNWERFAAFDAVPKALNDSTINVLSGVGTIHFPFNGTADFEECEYNQTCGYDYANSTYKLTRALSFAKYPDLENTWTLLNSDAWKNTEEGYLKFWYGLLPKAEGINADGRENNWWKYIYDYQRYPIGGKTINTKFQRNLTAYPDWQQFTEGTGTVLLFDLDDYYTDTDVALPQIRVSVHRDGINVYMVGSKMYAYIPANSAGFYNSSIRICDGSYTYTKYVNIFVRELNSKVKAAATSIKSSNYPNPFNTITTISYTLTKSSSVSIKIYNSAGKQIEELSSNINQPEGTHQINFDGAAYPPGIYYYSILNGEQFNMHKIVLLKE